MAKPRSSLGDFLLEMTDAHVEGLRVVFGDGGGGAGGGGGSGITPAELRAAFGDLQLGLSAQEVDFLIANFEQSAAGVITFDAFVQGVANLRRALKISTKLDRTATGSPAGSPAPAEGSPVARRARPRLARKKSMVQFVETVADDEVRALKELFDSCDLDSDGVIKRRELAEVMARMEVAVSAEELDTVFGELDADGDGQISFIEFVSGLRWVQQVLRFETLASDTGSGGSRAAAASPVDARAAAAAVGAQAMARGYRGSVSSDSAPATVSSEAGGGKRKTLTKEVKMFLEKTVGRAEELHAADDPLSAFCMLVTIRPLMATLKEESTAAKAVKLLNKYQELYTAWQPEARARQDSFVAAMAGSSSGAVSAGGGSGSSSQAALEKEVEDLRAQLKKERQARRRYKSDLDSIKSQRQSRGSTVSESDAGEFATESEPLMAGHRASVGRRDERRYEAEVEDDEACCVIL